MLCQHALCCDMYERINDGDSEIKAEIARCKTGYRHIYPGKKINMQYSVRVISFMFSSV